MIKERGILDSMKPLTLTIQRARLHLLLAFTVLSSIANISPLWAANAAESSIKILRLPNGLRFGLIGERPTRPSPTIFVFQGSLESLESEPLYTEVSRILQKRGFITVLLDAPAHGEDHRNGEPSELSAWRYRLEQGEDFVAKFTTGASELLDYLIAERFSDPGKVAAVGTSRGGFLAFHFAAADRRIATVAAFSPVTDLMALREFNGFVHPENIKKYSVIELAPRLVQRPVWVSIGNHDSRVGTDHVIAFTRALVKRSSEGLPDDALIPVELLVCPTEGHTNIENAHQRLASWLLEQFGSPPRKNGGIWGS